MTSRFWTWMLAGSSFLGILVMVYLTVLHYSATGSSWCNLGQGFNCDIVNKGIYSTVDGLINLVLGTNIWFLLPNAVLGVISFSIVFLGSLALLSGGAG